MSPKRQIPLQLFKLASDLGLKESNDPAESVVAHCRQQVDGFIAEHGDCSSLSELLSLSANKTGTLFEEIFSDADLATVCDTYTSLGEKVFANLPNELSGEVYGITFRRQNRRAWDHPFVSVIDSRGEKSARSYFTKWHEVAHLLTLTQQLRLVFRRTHAAPSAKDPEERLMDQIAGTLGFYGPVFHKCVDGTLTFSEIERLRKELCPEASIEASLLSFTKNWPSACLLIRGSMGLNKGQVSRADQNAFDFMEKPEPVLRATSITNSDSALRGQFGIYPNMRVPVTSIVHEVFDKQLPYGEAIEDLAEWTEQDSHSVKIMARWRRESVEALIVPTGL